eukprot:TRINITY_DN795_c0_g3_i9.p1 TRINITY_DN795_c0_g3~~TRINITY_DN795_c0_g3_i9.p1  ORF type:complete len:627 (+),score=151.86 TRINITY_DN795_c0_g3_i9:55-1881(+)
MLQKGYVAFALFFMLTAVSSWGATNNLQEQRNVMEKERRQSLKIEQLERALLQSQGGASRERLLARMLDLLLGGYHLPPIKSNTTHPIEECRSIFREKVFKTQVHLASPFGDDPRSPVSDFLLWLWAGGLSQPLLPTVRIVELRLMETSNASEIFNAAADNTHLVLRPSRPDLVLHSPAALVLRNKENLVIDFNNVTIMFGEPTNERHMLRVEHSRSVTLMNAHFSFPNIPEPGFYQQHGDNKTGLLLVFDSDLVAIKANTMTNSPQASIAISHSRKAWIGDNTILNSGAGGIILHGDTKECVVEGNRVDNTTGIANWHAGIVISYRQVDLREGVNLILSRHLHHDSAFSLLHRKQYPSRNAIVRNYVGHSSGQGIYVDGAVGNVIMGNEIHASSKEGLCLDGGATSNVVMDNHIHECGQRTKQLPLVLQQEVPDERKGADGLTIYKLPGVSVDNGLYNILLRNNVRNNFGGGIKLVRTSFFNLVVDNSLWNNNKGGSEHLSFPAVSLMNDPSDDHGATDLDYAPSVGNMIAYNTIRGRHGVAALIAPGSECNEIFFNTVKGELYFVLESVVEQTNFIKSTAPKKNLRTPERDVPEEGWPISQIRLGS